MVTYQFLCSGKVPSVHTHGSEFLNVWPVSFDHSNDKTYTDMTVCVRTKIISFPRLGEVNMFIMGSEEYGHVWFLGIFQPLSGMSDLGKQVF